MVGVPTAQFAMYASKDGSLYTITVVLDIEFVCSLLSAVKNAYFGHMIHQICISNL